MTAPSATDVAILCGGAGTRLRPIVSDRPKPLADVAGKPFLDHLIERAEAQGFRRFVLCAGYRGEMIENRYRGRKGPGTVAVSIEPSALGTAGGLRHAAASLRSDPVIVLNGDSFCEAALGAFLDFHAAHGARASMVLVRAAGDRYGRVERDPEGRLTAFREKGSGAPEGCINAGVYCLSAEVLRSIPAGRAVSLEREIFPGLLGRGLWGMEAKGPFVDIGLPEDLGRAQEIMARKR